MKNKYTTLTILMAFVSFGLFQQCTTNDSIFDEFPEGTHFERLQDVHDALIGMSNDTIIFQWDDTEQDTTFFTPEGAQIFLPNLSGGGGSGSGNGDGGAPYTVKLIELYNRGDMIRYNVQSFWHENGTDKALVSGGMLHLTLYDANGQELEGTPGGIYAKIPNRTDADGYFDNMFPFIGIPMMQPSGTYVDSYWINHGTDAEVTYDPNEGQNGKYTIYNLLKGWNQPGADYTAEAEQTQFSAMANPLPQDYSDTEIFFVSTDHTVVVALTMVDGFYLKTIDQSIPKGIEGSLIAISVDGSQLYFGKQEVQITGDDAFEVNMTQGSIEDLLTLLNSLD